MHTRHIWTYFVTILLVSTAACSCWGQAPTTVDDKAPAWIWDHMAPCDSVDPSITSAHAGGPGSSGTYIFSGTGVTVFGVSARTVQVNNVIHHTGKVRVTLDGSVKGEFPEYTSGQAANTPVCTVHGLPDGNHSIILEPVDGWAGVSSLNIDHSASTGAAVVPIKGDYFTDFKSGDTKAWVPYGGTWALNGQWYVGSPDDGNKTILSGSDYSNFTFDTDLVENGTGDCGVVFRVSSPSAGTDAYNGYYVGLDTQKQAVVIGKASGDWTQLTLQPYTIQQGAKYHLRVIAAGNVISAYVQGIYICSVNDSSYTSGAVGLRTFGVQGAFTNVSIAKGGH